LAAILESFYNSLTDGIAKEFLCITLLNMKFESFDILFSKSNTGMGFSKS
jgi:hypothetical protein